MPNQRYVIICVAVFFLASLLLSTHSFESPKFGKILAQMVFLADRVFATSKDSRAEYYAEQHHFDPLFSLPGADLELLENYVRALVESRDSLLPYFNLGEQEIIESALYPESFLVTLPETERARRELEEKPSPARATHYHAELLRTIRAYRSSAELMKSSIDRLDSKNIAFWDGATNKQHISDALRTIVASSVASETKENLRYACFTGSLFSCRTLERDSPNTTHKAEQKISPTPSEEILEHARIIISYLTAATVRHNTGLSERPLSHIPLIYIESPECSREHTGDWYIAWWHMTRSGERRAARIANLNDLLLYDLSKAPGPYYQELYRRGAQYQLQLLNPYVCANYDSTARSAFSILYLEEQTRLNPLFISRESKLPEIQRLKSIEKEIIGQNVLNAVRADEYVDIGRSLIARYQGKELVHGMETATMKELKKRISVIESGSAYFETRLGTIEDMGQTARHVLEKQEMPLDAFILTRSFISTLFLLENRTVQSVPIDLISDPKTAWAEPFARSYKDDLRSTLSPERIVSVLLETNDVVSKVFGD